MGGAQDPRLGAPSRGKETMHPGTMDLKLMADDVAEAYSRAGFDAWTAEFFYPTPRTVLSGTPSQVSRLPILFESDSFFCFLGTLIDIRDSNGVIGYRPAIGMQIQDMDSGYFFSDMLAGPIPAQLHSGMPGTPYQLDYPYVFPPGGRATVTLMTLDTAHLGTVIVTLWGLKIFTRPYSRDVHLPDHW